MQRWRLSGLDPARFEPLFQLPEEALARLGALRRTADEDFGFPCRIGLQRAHGMFVNGEPVDQAKLEALLEALELGSLCAHGGGMPAPIRSLLEHWPEELGLA